LPIVKDLNEVIIGPISEYKMRAIHPQSKLFARVIAISVEFMLRANLNWVIPIIAQRNYDSI
jgi:hypothetical protein